jgi:hypothetical protein
VFHDSAQLQQASAAGFRPAATASGLSDRSAILKNEMSRDIGTSYGNPSADPRRGLSAGRQATDCLGLPSRAPTNHIACNSIEQVGTEGGTEELPSRLAADNAYQNTQKNSDKQNARIEHDKALGRVMTAVLKDDTELFKQFMDNDSFRNWMMDTVFGLTYQETAPGA